MPRGGDDGCRSTGEMGDAVRSGLLICDRQEEGVVGRGILNLLYCLPPLLSVRVAVTSCPSFLLRHVVLVCASWISNPCE